jgi:hypothetical protein
MIAVPGATPVNTPVTALIVATAVLADTQLPPDTELVKVVLLPIHTEATPNIAGGSALTVTVTNLKQPFEEMYETRVVPAEIPLTIPEAEPTEAIAEEEEFQVPPAVTDVSEVDDPTQVYNKPDIVAGKD